VSATGRSDVRADRDLYLTPRWCTEVLLSRVRLTPVVVEPGCGQLAISRVLRDHGHHVTGLDTYPAASERGILTIERDWLKSDARTAPHDVVMNPPYRLAAEFIRKALEVSDGQVCALLRLNFLGSSRKRIDLVGPGSTLRRVIVVSKRPSFTGDGKTDACEYAWFVWSPDGSGTTIEVVPPEECR
jgi:hypothetical protein